MNDFAVNLMGAVREHNATLQTITPGQPEQLIGVKELEPREQGYHVPGDGTSSPLQANFPVRSATVVNSSDQRLTLLSDNGDRFYFDPGGHTTRLPSSTVWAAQLAGAVGNLGTCWIILSDRVHLGADVSGDDQGSGTGGAVPARGAAHHTASVITIAAGVGALAARATRTSAVLSAPITNVADIIVGAAGFHIAPGGVLQVSALDVFAFSGTNGDTLSVYEEYN